MRTRFYFDPLLGTGDAPPTLRPSSVNGGMADPAHAFIGIAGNPLSQAEHVAARVADAGHARCVCWSGWIEDDIVGGDGDRNEMRSPRTWSGPGWEALMAFCQAVEGRFSSSNTDRRKSERRTVAFWTHAGTVLSDAPSCLRFLAEASRRWSDGPVAFSLVVDPAGMLTPSMQATAEDHAQRLVELLGSQPSVVAMVASPLGARQANGATPMRAWHPAHQIERQAVRTLASLTPSALEALLPPRMAIALAIQ